MLRWVDLSTLYLIDAITCIAPIWATVRLAPMPPTRRRRTDRRVGLRRGARRLPLPGGQHRGADVVRRRPDRDDLRHAAGAVPADGARELRRSGRGRHHDGAAVRGDVGGCGRGRGVLRLAAAGPAPGSGRRGRDRGVGRGDGRVRGGRRVGRRACRARCCGLRWCSSAIGGAADMVSAAFRSTILQQAASDDVRGRLQGVFTVVVAGGPRVADAVHGAAAAAVGTTVAAAGGGGAGRGRCGDRGAARACVRPLPGHPGGRQRTCAGRRQV